MKVRKPIVVYWNNIPSPYMVERFNAVADRGTLDFEAWFNDRIEPDRSWDVDESKWRFRYRYMPASRIAGRRLRWAFPLLTCRPDVLVSLYAEPVFLVGWVIAKLRGCLTGFWVEVTFDRWVKRSWWKESLKRFIFPRINAVITVSTDGANFSKKYGAKSEQIFYAPHVIDVDHFNRGSKAAHKKRDEYRDEYGLVGITFIYVGRLWSGKGVNHLLDAFDQVRRNGGKEVSLFLVGDGPDEATLKKQCVERRIGNVVFAGFKQKPELPSCYAMADVFVFPTLGDPYGLVVDEAMACSLPVISTSAAGEIRDRIDDGVNGYIVPPEDSVALAERMMEIIRDPDLCRQMGERSYEKIKDHTPEWWAEAFEAIILKLI